nr:MULTISPECIES: hypothetical protein [Haloferax]
MVFTDTFDLPNDVARSQRIGHLVSLHTSVDHEADVCLTEYLAISHDERTIGEFTYVREHVIFV